MTERDKLKCAKDCALARLDDKLNDWEKNPLAYEWASLEEVDGEEVWVVLKLEAKKKNFNIEDFCQK